MAENLSGPDLEAAIRAAHKVDLSGIAGLASGGGDGWDFAGDNNGGYLLGGQEYAGTTTEFDVIGTLRTDAVDRVAESESWRERLVEELPADVPHMVTHGLADAVAANAAEIATARLRRMSA